MRGVLVACREEVPAATPVRLMARVTATIAMRDAATRGAGRDMGHLSVAEGRRDADAPIPDLTAGEGGGVASRFLGGSAQAPERRVGGAVRVQVERGGVMGVEPLDQVLGGQRSPAGRAGFDP